MEIAPRVRLDRRGRATGSAPPRQPHDARRHPGHEHERENHRGTAGNDLNETQIDDVQEKDEGGRTSDREHENHSDGSEPRSAGHAARHPVGRSPPIGQQSGGIRELLFRHPDLRTCRSVDPICHHGPGEACTA